MGDQTSTTWCRYSHMPYVAATFVACELIPDRETIGAVAHMEPTHEARWQVMKLCASDACHVGL